MNCLEFRRAKLADPHHCGPEARGHVVECADCARFAAGVAETEARLADILTVRVPEGLAERVLLNRRRTTPRWSMWGLAASVVVGIALGFQALRPVDADNHARRAIQHVLSEPQLLRADAEVDPRGLREVFSDLGGTLDAPIGRIRHMAPCPEAPHKAWHVVFDGPDGLATLILVRNESVPSSESASDSGLNALVRPAPRGYYAVVTESPAATASADRLIRQRVQWHAHAAPLLIARAGD